MGIGESGARTVADGGVRVDEVPVDLLEPLGKVEAFMKESLAGFGLPENLRAASSYALLAGGKRLRPLLTLHSCAAVGGEMTSATAAAAAVEMIHAFSLVHDDLPALDNDDLRRGRPTLHRAHGEPMAILAGDGLMSMAFQIIAERYEGSRAGALCRELASGTTAMIAGQVLDTLGGFDPGLSDREKLEAVHRNKTGALMRVSCRMGALAADAGEAELGMISAYGESIGLMFQVVDDLVDAISSSDHAGKKTGKDHEAGKLTYPGLIGIEGSRSEIERLRLRAIDAIRPLGPRADALRRICEYLAVRTR